MGTLLSSSLYFSPPSKPSYSVTSLGSPPLIFVHGVPCLWYENATKNAPIILYLHCNFTDLGMQRNLCYQMSKHVQCHVLAMEYPGFGIHPGKPSAESAVKSAFLVYDWACAKAERVFIMGRSIGTGVAGCFMYELFQQTILRQPDGLILHSAFLSMAEVWAAYIGSTLARYYLWEDMNTEYNLSHAPPKKLLIMHGANDRLFSVWHAHQLLNRIPCPEKTLFVHPNDSHTRISWYEVFPIIKNWI